jgi:hypothetical protein
MAAFRSRETFCEEEFLARMTRDGRLTIPRLALRLLQGESDGEFLEGHVLEVRLEPSEEEPEKGP